MTDKERDALALRIEALEIAVDALFLSVPSGQKAKETFRARLKQLSIEAEGDPERQNQLRIELESWSMSRS